MRRLWTPTWLLVHAAALILVVAFLLLGWWQMNRAAAGNVISYGYAVQWPAFAAFVVFVWVKEMRRARRESTEPPGQRHSAPGPARAERGQRNSAPGPARAERGQRNSAYDDSGDEQLAAYNRYLAWLNAHPAASPRDYPG